MKLTTSVLILALAASASAQQKPTTTAPAPAKPAAAAPSKAATPAVTTKSTPAPATKATPAPATKTAAKTPAPAPKVAAKPVAKPAKTTTAHKASSHKTSTHAVAKKSTAPAKPAAAKTEGTEVAKAVSRGSARDPFESVIRERGAEGPCSAGGKQCLVADEVALRGIVRSSNGMIAVVTNKENRAYFLRENDPVFNGVVTRITEGSVTFKEHSTDVFGKTVTREVVKKINPKEA